jgi:pyruvate/2-oxoglutarate dehydrogenase complex dihydrolipoamide dehydrogenase (E3) component
VNELHGYDIEDLKIGMHASFVKTITEADIVLFADGEIVIDGDALVTTTSREVREPESTGRSRQGALVGPSAGDLIAKRRLRSKWGADATDIGLTIHPHPTLSETIGMAAEAFEGTITDLYIPKKK